MAEKHFKTTAKNMVTEDTVVGVILAENEEDAIEKTYKSLKAGRWEVQVTACELCLDENDYAPVEILDGDV